MDTDFLSLALRAETPRVRTPNRVVFQTFNEEHLRVVNETLAKLDLRPIGVSLQHHGLQMDFRNEGDAALMKLAMPPLR